MNAAEPSPPIDFALLGHPDSYDHLGDILVHSRPDYDREKLGKYQATLSKFFEWAPSYAAKTPLEIENAAGQFLSGRLVICTFLPEKIAGPREMKSAYNKARAGYGVARELGANMVGLGGFTSIVGGSQGERLVRELGGAATSGNSLTAALALAQLDALLERLNWDLTGRTVAILGATGDIGRACAMALVPRAGHLVLVARNRVKLEKFQAELGEQVSTTIVTDVKQAATADIIVAATSATQPILSEADLKTGSIVCDIGYPKNLSYSSAPRPDVLVISAGLAEMPFELDIQYYTRLPTASQIFGCFAEAMILTMNGQYESYSVGQGRITLEKLGYILNLAQEQGFRPAPLYRGDESITDADVELFLEKNHK